MSITNKVTVGLVSFAFVFSLFVVNTATAATDAEIALLQAQIAQLLEQIKGLESGSSSSSSGSTYTSTSTSGSNAACSYTWTRNLSIGSTGDDVRQLQRFLNGNPQTQVAVTGVGSPGNESSYYGPATARAVSKFQEMHAAQILTPLGLTQGTGGFYTSTRAKLNEVCQGSGSSISVNRAETRSATSPAVVRVTGDALAVTAGNPISDSYVVLGAQRAPFTSVVLTAGSDDVRIESIRIKRFGLSSSDNFESIALVDANGVQVGSARSLNSRDEVSLGSNFIVPANRSVTLAVIGNMTTDDDEFSSGSIAGLEVAEVVADTRVQGTFPIRGAAHVLSSSIALQTVEISVGGGGGSIEFNEDTEVASVNIDLISGDADAEDAYLRSVILEQVGTADVSDLGDLMVYVEDERVDHTITVDRDRFIINFGGKGVMIEEGDDVEIVVEVNTDRGYEESVQFAIDDVSDVYVLGATYGYGLPVCFSGDTDCESDGGSEKGEVGTTVTHEATISSGSVAKGSRLKKFEDEVRYGDDVILGAYSFEFEGEDVLMEDLTFKVAMKGYDYTDEDDNAWESADEETVRFDSVRLRIDGENVAYANDSIDFDEPDCSTDSPDAANVKNHYSTDADCDGTEDDDGRLTVEFDGGFTVDVRGDREVVFEIVADLDSAWSHFDGTSVEFTLVDVDTAEGASSEKDYTEGDEYFATAKDFESVKIMGNEVRFAINNDGVDGNEEFVSGADGVVFGTLEVDAKDAIDDVEVRDLYISFQIPSDADTSSITDGAVGDLSDLNNCRILDESGDEIADSRGVTGKKETDDSAAESSQARFRFDDYVVEAGEREDLDIVCDIDDGAEAGDVYKIAAASDDRVKYRIGRDEEEAMLDDDSSSFDDNASSLIVVGTSGMLKIATDNPDEDESVIAVATGSGGVDDVAVLEIELEAESEDIEIVDVYLVLPSTMGAGSVTTSGDELEKVYDRFTLNLGNVAADADDFDNGAGSGITFPAYNADSAPNGYRGIGGDLTISQAIKFEDVNEVVREGDSGAETFDLTIDFNGIDDNDGVAGQFIEGSGLIVVWEGADSGAKGVTTYPSTIDDTAMPGFTVALPFPTVPTISTTETTQTLTQGKKRKIYEFTVHADDEGDVYLGQVGLDITLLNGVTLANIGISRGTEPGTSRTKSNVANSGSIYAVEFTESEEIDAGTSRVYTVFADVVLPSSGDNIGIVTALAADDKGTRSLGVAYATNVGNLVWSPNTLDKDGSTAATGNDDWFNGWAVLDSTDIKSWTLSQ